MKKLKFLDCYEVTKEERQMIKDDSLFLDVVTPNEATPNGAASRRSEEDKTNANYTPLTHLDTNKHEQKDAKGSFGYCRYIYYGKQSEGNRFIRNDDL